MIPGIERGSITPGMHKAYLRRKRSRENLYITVLSLQDGICYFCCISITDMSKDDQSRHLVACEYRI